MGRWPHGLQLVRSPLVTSCLRCLKREVVGTGGSGFSVDVTVAENGSPTTARHAGAVPGSGRGLLGLSERVRTVGGAFEHGPVQGGYRVHAVLPWVPVRGGAV